MSSSNIKLPPLRNNNNEEGVDLVQLKQRFDKQLPKYGFMWRSMNNARLVQEKANSNNNNNKPTIVNNKQQQNHNGEDKENNIITPNVQKEEQPNLLTAILTKQPVQLGVHNSELCDENCNCAEPIIEIDDDNIDENNSVYDVDVDEELADTDDDDEEGSGGSIKSSGEDTRLSVEKDKEVVGDKSMEDESRSEEINIDDSMSSEESIILVSKTPKKKKMVIIDSDDEESEFEDNMEDESLNVDESLIEEDRDGVDEQEAVNKSMDGAFTLSDAEDKSIVQSTSPKKKRYTRLRNSKAKPLQILDNNDDDDSEDLKSTTSSEEEWIELSSDEEEAAAPKQDLTVVILSDDDDLEESESEEDDDNHSAFTISSNDDSGGSDSDEESVGPSFRKTTKKQPDTKKTSSSGERTTSKPSATKSTKTKPKDMTKPNRAKTSQKSSTSAAFRKNRINLTKHTFEEFNQQAFGGALSSVEVTWSNKLNTTAGITRMRGKLGKNNADSRVASIDLATKVIDNEERLRSTLLHEMCHAAQWLVDGCHKPPHGDVFKKWANISMRKIRDVEVTTTHDYEISYKFAWACTGANCNVVIKRHSRSVDVNKQCCGRCKGKLIEIEVPGSKGDKAKNGKHTPKKARKASAYSLFVKSESANVRKRLAKERSCTPKSVSQADVMKEVGRLWRIKKENKDDGGLDLTSRLVNMTLGDDAKTP